MLAPVFSTTILRGATLAALLAAGTATTAVAQDGDNPWPIQIDDPRATIIVYQPQPESFDNNIVTARAALSVTEAGKTEPVFGVMWISARLETDRDTRTARILEIDVTAVRFPESTAEQEQTLAQIIETEIPQWDLEISLDRLSASLALLDEQRATSDQLKTDPPVILVVTHPAVLVTIDGDPIIEDIDNTDMKTVVNTAFAIIYDPGTKRYYLYAADSAWYASHEVLDGWETTNAVPDKVSGLIPPDTTEAAADSTRPADAEIPAIIVATVPTELIVTEGAPQFASVDGTDLLYLSNSQSDVLMDIDSQQYYIVLSGRWYRAGSLNGPWAFVAADSLPATFQDIPPDSEQGPLRWYIAGTDEAKDAVMDSQIPQTAAVKRSEAKLNVEYDGDPQFKPIEDTDMEYAVNTQTSVILAEGKYYAVDDAVWFVAGSPTGPWVLADSVPDVIYTMPPSAPVYNVKYVYIYQTTPEVVYVGYYPGYTGSYVYYSTVVYGTGWYYQPWYGTVYYPRPVTWGFSVRYNPWYGWSYGFGWTNGWFMFGIGMHWGWRRCCYGAWWGRGGYRAGYRHGYYHGRRAGFRAGYRAGYRAGNRPRTRQNVYHNNRNRARTTQARPATANRRPSSAVGRPNNVYADRNGNVKRRNNNGSWDSRGSGGWQPNTGGGNRAGSPSNMNRDYQSRQRGTSRTQSYNSYRGGGGRGGGGRRR